MASDSELQNLTELTAPAAADVCYIVDDPAGTPLARKVQVSNLIGYLVTTAGDILYATAARTLARLGIGSATQVLKGGTSAPVWGTCPTADVATTAGDTFYATGADTPARLAIGTARQVLQTNSGATAPEWAASPQSLLTAQADLLYASSANTLARLAKGSAYQVLRVNSGATAPEWGTISAQMFLSAAAGVPKTTGGCAAAAQVEMATNKQNVKVLDFDKDTEEHADWTFAMPSDYGGGTMTAQFYWMHAAATAYNVVWGIEGICYADGDAMDAAVGTAVTVTDSGGTTTDVYISAATGAITWAGTPAAGQLINLTVFRKAADAADTLDVDGRLLGIQLNYTRA